MSMNWVDYAIVAVIAVSALISLVRGFVREMISLLVWTAAFWIGIHFTPDLSTFLARYVGSPTLRAGAAFTMLFVATLLLGAMVNYIAAQLVDRTGLTGTDRFAGVLFGLARGVLVVAALVLLAGLTTMPRERWWRQSVLVARIQPLACRIGVGDWMKGLIVYSPLTEGSPVVRGKPAANYWSEFCRSPAKRARRSPTSETADITSQ